MREDADTAAVRCGAARDHWFWARGAQAAGLSCRRRVWTLRSSRPRSTSARSKIDIWRAAARSKAWLSSWRKPRRSRSAPSVRTPIASAPIRRSRSKARSCTSPAILPKAAQTLAALSGKTHRLTSAFCVARAGQALVVHSDHADLRMRALDPAEISRYLERAGTVGVELGRRVSGRGSRNSSVRAHRRGSFRCSRTADVESPCLDAPRKSDLAVIETRAPRAGVAGWPIEHSRSPTIHRYWLKELGLPGSYEKFAVRPGEFRRVRRQDRRRRTRWRQRHGASQGSRLQRLRRANAGRRSSRGGQHACGDRTDVCGATTPTSPAFWPTWTRARPAGRSGGNWPWSSALAARPERSSTH